MAAKGLRKLVDIHESGIPSLSAVLEKFLAAYQIAWNCHHLDGGAVCRYYVQRRDLCWAKAVLEISQIRRIAEGRRERT